MIRRQLKAGKTGASEKKEPKVPVNPDLLEGTLEKLLDNKIKNLKLILKKEDNIYLRFSYSKKVLKVSLPHVKQLITKGILNEHRINAFQRLGFRSVETEKHLVLMLTGDNNNILDRLKTTLSRIVFDIFYFTAFRKGCFIEFTKKADLPSSSKQSGA